MINLIKFYKTCIRSLLEYCCAVFHDSLPDYLHLRLERIQIRCMSIIYPGTTYENALRNASLPSLKQRRGKLVAKLFTNIIKDQDHQLNCLLPKKNDPAIIFERKIHFLYLNVELIAIKTLLSLLTFLSLAINCILI